MKLILSVVLTVLQITVAAQVNQVIIGSIDTIHSRILNEKRTIWVYAPKTEPSAAYGKVKYPVVYLLDGNEHFSSVTSMIRQLSEGYTNFFPRMIIVGILNTDRMRDLTPTHIKGLSDYSDSSIFKTTGGGNNFMSFMEKELIPHIDSSYSTSPYRMFIGHSLGGLMVVDALLHYKHLFNSYVAIDPSLWYDDRNLLRQSGSRLSKEDFSRETFYLAIANTMKPGLDTGAVRKDVSNNTSHIRAILDFTNLLKLDKKSGLKWDYKYYGDDDHGSVPLIAEYDALRFIFNNYRLPPWEIMTDSTYHTDSVLTSRFREISLSWGYTVHPPEQYVNSLGYSFLQKKQFEKSFLFFNMNLRNYPESFNVYDSMGDFYLAKGDKLKAQEFFTRALLIMENPATKEKLEKLKSGK